MDPWGRALESVFDRCPVSGDSGFVLDVLKEADEKFERRYEMKRLGYNLNTIEDHICEICKAPRTPTFGRARPCWFIPM